MHFRLDPSEIALYQTNSSGQLVKTQFISHNFDLECIKFLKFTGNLVLLQDSCSSQILLKHIKDIFSSGSFSEHRFLFEHGQNLEEVPCVGRASKIDSSYFLRTSSGFYLLRSAKKSQSQTSNSTFGLIIDSLH